MPPWSALALVSLFSTLALLVTVATWRRRRATPRRLSLLLATAACGAIVLAAVDISIPLPSALCVRRLAADDRPLAAALADTLDDWGWWWRPCRRLQLDVTIDDLGTPIDFAALAASAAASSVAVDVSLAGAATWPGEALEWAVVAGDHTRPIDAPIPASMSDAVHPRFEGDRVTRPICELDRDSADHGHDTLDELLDARTDQQNTGFHLLQCRHPSLPNAPPLSAYVHVTRGGVVLASSDPQNIQDITLGTNADHFELLPQLDAVAEGHPSLGAASLLVLDRPKHPASCRQAQTLLQRGATVVVAMPEDSFFRDCPLPLTPALLTRSGASIRFDRRPRLTYLLDDFADDLRDLPGFLFQTNRPGQVTSPIPAETSSKLQREQAVESCGDVASTLFNIPAPCEPTTGTPPDDFAAMRIPELPRSHASTDKQRIDRSAPESRLKLYDESLAAADARVYWENETVIVFTHDPRPTKESAWAPFLERGFRVHRAQIRDPYGRSLGPLHKKPLPEKSSPSKLVTEITGRLDYPSPARPCGTETARCIPDIKFPARDVPQTRAQTSKLGGRFAVDLATPTEAPVRFGWWLPARERVPGGLASIVTTTEDAGLAARPLAIGALVGRGHLLFLSYTPFDAAPEWKGAPAPNDILGGYKPIESLYAATEQQLVRLASPVLAVERKPDGAVWITLDADPSRVFPFSRVFRERDGRREIRAPLVDFHVAQRTLTYALPAAELRGLTRCTPFLASKDGSTEPERHDPIHACPPDRDAEAGVGIDAATGLRLLARYSGGSLGSVPAGDALHTRPLGLGLLSLLFLVAWGRRAVRRLSARVVRRRMRRLEHHAQRRYDPPDAVAAAAGDWDGRSSTWPRTGAFGGFRAIEAGDRPDAVVLQDLVLPALGGPRQMPRVATRIEEASPAVVVLVNLGASMRVPGGINPIKVTFAGRVALHLAATAWKIGGEVTIHAVGVRDDCEIVETTRLSPGAEALDGVRRCLRQRPASGRAPWPEELPECGAVVYVSDFQLEDASRMQQWLARLEGAGIRAGGVLIYSPVEFTMIEGGRLAGSAAWAERADWDPDDVFAAFDRRRGAIEHIFDTVTTGGLVVASTHFSQDDLEIVLAGGRLLQILR
ncbi:MAG: hypothetical protein JNL82_15280 [Myxococcales bacterium]|nr:hypothetical protein [Myxococcales bacterium]